MTIDNRCRIVSQNATPTLQKRTVSVPPVQGREEVQLEKRGSSYYVPVRINDTITIPFLLDTGAGDLAIPENTSAYR